MPKGRLRAVPLDVTDPHGLRQLAKQVLHEFGGVDVLVNNAAAHYDPWQKAVNADLFIAAKRGRPTCSARGSAPRHSCPSCAAATNPGSSW